MTFFVILLAIFLVVALAIAIQAHRNHAAFKAQMARDLEFLRQDISTTRRKLAAMTTP